ncbi:MAG: hypothetical protein KDA91_19340 [Planctomycetaceae bacterium]|nr:hypothetical protein [Planctomycetaceae bacterium]
MFQTLEAFLTGFSAVVSTALLLVLMERVNRSVVPAWLRVLVFGGWLWHAGCFLHVMLADSSGLLALRLDQLVIVTMCAGLLLMPSGMLHAAFRLKQSGLDPRPEFDWRFTLLYLPVLWLPGLILLVTRNVSRDFLTVVAPMIPLYLVWLFSADLMAAVLFWKVRNSISAPSAPAFFSRLIAALVLTTLSVILYCTVAIDTPIDRWLRLTTTLLPLIPALLFVWYTLRQRLLPLVLERTILYGAAIVAILMVHRLVVTPISAAVERTSDLDFVLIESLAVLLAVLAYTPVRARVREALRNLVSRDLMQTREAARRIAVDLSRRSGDSPNEIIHWFQSVIQSTFNVRSCRIEMWGETHLNRETEEILKALQSLDVPCLDRGDDLNDAVESAMVRSEVMWAVPIRFQSVDGAVLLGARNRNDRLGIEQLSTLRMLCEQFAATLHNRQVDLKRLAAERKAMQAEKLSVLGLIAGSLAHEIKNPLSSMQTIAQVVLEDLGERHECAQDIQLILNEIDRLNQTTGRLLEYARPANADTAYCRPDHIIQRLLHILSILARQYHVVLITTLQATNIVVAGSEEAMWEVLFNLIKNAIEAVRDQADGVVSISSSVNSVLSESIVGDGHRVIKVCVTDNGPGVPPGMLDGIYEPFVSSKSNGTGLGLYIAAERIREMHGSIRCESVPTGGTVFSLELPVFEE